jgi:amino acid adenylation domain-containing protein
VTVEKLLRRLKELDIQILLDGDRVKFRAPKGRLTPDLELDLAEHKQEIIQALRAADTAAAHNKIPHVTGQARAPLSFGQERLWFLQRLEPENPAHNITAHLRVNGRMDLNLLRAAFREVLRRHEVLRSKFPEVNGAPMQEVQDTYELPFAAVDAGDMRQADRFKALDAAIDEQARRPFDLSRELPVRASVFQVDREDYAFILTIHHIAADEASIDIFFKEINALYAAFASGLPSVMPDLPVQYADFARWERQRAQTPEAKEQFDYWMKKLHGSEGLLNLPIDHPAGATSRFKGAVHDFELEAADSERLIRLAKQEGVTLFMALLAIFQALLVRYTGDTDISVVSPVSTRTQAELGSVIGFFVNTFVLRTEFAPAMTTRDLLHSVRETVLDAHDHMEVPFEKIVQQLSPGRSADRSPFLQTAFVMQTLSGSAEYKMASGGAIFDMTLYVRDRGGRIGGSFEYSAELFDAATIERFAHHFALLASEMSSRPDESISQLSILSPVEKRQLLGEWSGVTTEYPRNSSIQELFVEAARARGNSIALQVVAADSVPREKRQMGYAELDRRTNQLARYLAHKCGVTAKSRVGLCMERGIDAIIAILGIVKTGAAYVPLDPAYPKGRLEFMLADADVNVLIAQSETLGFEAKRDLKVIALDKHWEQIEKETAEALDSRSTADSHAYLMYTSGSTGEPKGVCVPHRAVVRLVRNTNFAKFTAEDAFLACGPLSFDASTLEIWGALLNGGRLVIMPQAIPTPSEIAAAISKYDVTVLWLTSALFHQVVQNEAEALAQVRTVLAGGDVLAPDDVRRLLDLMRPGPSLGNSLNHSPIKSLTNGYGPTENTTFTCCHVMHHGDEIGNSVPIGKPIANTRVYVLDASMQPVPIGVAGELYVGGDGLAQGYWNREDLTAAKFVPDPFATTHGRRLYRTGDLVRFMLGGTLEFMGRRDRQVKVRGFRIELEEIESAISKHPDVREAVVLARKDHAGSTSLVGYVVAKGEPKNLTAELGAFLADKLPDHMIPSSWIELEKLPLTPSGKLDREALPSPAEQRSEVVEPRTPLEMQLLAIWEQVLNVRNIGINSSFFELGGHSLLAVALISQLEKIFGMLPVSILFQAPTVERMAALLSSRGLELPWRSLVAIQTSGSSAPLFLVPGVGGNVLGYADLAKHLGPDQPVYGLQSRGLGGEKNPLDTIEKIAANFIGEIRTVQPKGPYRLAGACMGGAVAYEMAQQLKASGEEMEMLALIETWPPDYVEKASLNPFHQLDPVVVVGKRVVENVRNLVRADKRKRGEFVRDRMNKVKTIIRSRGLPADTRADLLRENVTRANHRAVSRYQPKPYPGQILFFLAGARELSAGADPRLAWADLAKGGCSIHKIETKDSGWMLKEPFVGILAERLKTHLKGETTS